MRVISALAQSSIFLLILTLGVPATAEAYIDPGAGSALIAILVGGFTGAMFLFQTWKNKLRTKFSPKDDATDDDQEPKKED